MYDCLWLCVCMCFTVYCSKTWRKMLWKLISLLFVFDFLPAWECNFSCVFLIIYEWLQIAGALIESDTESATVYQRLSVTPTLHTLSPSHPLLGELTIDFHVVRAAMQTENLWRRCCWWIVVVAISGGGGASCHCLQCWCRPVIVASPASAKKWDSYICSSKSKCMYACVCVNSRVQTMIDRYRYVSTALIAFGIFCLIYSAKKNTSALKRNLCEYKTQKRIKPRLMAAKCGI